MLSTLAIMAVAAVAYAHPEQLVDTAWVAAHGSDASVRIVDMRQSGYDGGHVAGAVYLSPVAIRDAKNPPTFLPSPQAFAEMMASSGLATRRVSSPTTNGVASTRRGSGGF